MGNYLINKIGSYGPTDSSVTTINGNINLNLPTAQGADTITLSNLNIQGNLNINFGAGNVILNNMVVNGINVSNVGKNSLHIKGNSSIKFLSINDTDNDAHIVVEDGASVDNAEILSGAKLEVLSTTNKQKAFNNIVIKPTDKTKEILLEGTFNNINIKGDSVVKIAKNSEVLNNLKIESATTLIADESAKIGKIDINSKKEDTVSLSGNFNNVNVNTATSIEVKSGAISISSNTKEVVKLNVNEGASVKTGRGSDNINTDNSKGKIEKKTNLNTENFIKKVMTDNSEVSNYGVKIPAGIKVKELLGNIVTSDFATVELVSNSGNTINLEDYLTELMKVKVTSESGAMKKYQITFNYENGRTESLKGFGIDRDYEQNIKNIDENNKKGSFTGTIKFNGLNDETYVNGYYLSVYGEKLEKGNNETITHLTYDLLYQVFIPKENKANYAYRLENLDLHEYKMMYTIISPVINNRIISRYHNELFDTPVNNMVPNLDGVSIDAFNDTNNEKGKISGTISFTKAKDETNIQYYRVRVISTYISDGENREIRNYEHMFIPADCKNGKYLTDDMNYINVELAQKIEIVVTAFNEDGIASLMKSSIIQDNPVDQTLEVKKPKLFENSSQQNALNFTNIMQGANIKVYKYSSDANNYVDYKTSSMLVSVNDSYGKILNLEIGRYKVTEGFGEKVSEKSNEAVVRPNILTCQLINGKLTISDSLENSTINIYNKKGESVKTIVKEPGKNPVVADLKDGLYFITQTVSGIESNKAVAPINVDYTLNDIKAIIVDSFNKANINAKLEGDNIVLSKKSDAKIGEVRIDTGANLELSTEMNWELIRGISGDTQYKNATHIALQFDMNYADLKKLKNNLVLEGTYNGKRFNFNIKLSDEIIVQ